MLGATGLGILIGSVCNNTLQAILLSIASVFPSLYLGGVMTPLENLPPLLQTIGQGLPMTHFMIAANGIFQKGNGFAILWPEAVKLLAMGGSFMLAGCLIARRQWKQ